MFKWLKRSRKEDGLFEQDQAKNNTKRGNQVQFSYRQFLITNLIIFIVSYLISFSIILLIYSGIVKGLRLIYLGLITNTSLSEKTTVRNESYRNIVFDIPKSMNLHLLVVLIISLLIALWLFRKLYRRNKAKRVKHDHTDLNTFVGDKKKLTVEEMFTQYAIVPDAGAKSKTVKPTSIVGHAFLDNKMRLKKFRMAKRDEDGNVEKNDKGEILYENVKIFDKTLQRESYESIGIKNKAQQITYNPFEMKYRKRKNGKWQTVGEFINEDWYMPEHELQRPAGVYFVETGPVNTVSIGTTRSAKGQTFVNNSIDMFSREEEIQNMFINDPKGELFAAFHKLLETRGYEPVVLNLMDPKRTHQFNVLAPAIAQARIGKFDKMGSLLTTIMSTFFPKQKDDPFWGEATQALVKMIIYAMIDYYLEEERAYLQRYSGVKDEATISRELDEMWGKVTMFNAYQMITTMSRREVKLKDPKDPESEPEQLTQLSAYFKLTDRLPQNKMRIITLQQSDAMNEMAGSEKTRATVYGIALVAMLFFTEGPIMAITSASPKQSLDPVSLAFPRRLRFKLNSDFVKENRLSERKVQFSAYRDKLFSDQIKTENPIDFEHTSRIDDLGWVEFRFKGIFEEYKYIEEFDGTKTRVPKPVYIKMQVLDDKTNLTMNTYYFEFMRGYAKTVDGKRFILNPHDGKRVEKDGTIRVGHFKDKQGFVKGDAPLASLTNGMRVPEIEQTEAVYNIRPKAIFSVTPPHLSEYIKVVIVMVSVLFDTSVSESYVTNESGKPHYKTRNILDEVGNMHYNGNGIPDLQTKLSIGLGQGQEYLMVVQTLQQFRDVYGDSVDKIVQSNTAVFMYLISNDTDMLDMLSKQAGTTHKARATNKSINEKRTDMIDSMDEMVQTQYSVDEEPLFSINELLSFTTGESMVLSARHDKDNSGEKVRPNPIHNTGGTMIPMAYALHKNGHNHPKFKKALQNVEIATSSSNRDVYQDIPDFDEMFRKREKQAFYTEEAREKYKASYNLSDTDLIKQDVDEVSRNIMRIVNGKIDQDNQVEANDDNLTDKDKEIRDEMSQFDEEHDLAASDINSESEKQYSDNVERGEQTGQDKYEIENEKIFVNGTVSIEDMRERQWLKEIIGRALFENHQSVQKIQNELYQFIASDGVKRIIETESGSEIATYNAMEDNQNQSWQVTDNFFENIFNHFDLKVDEVDQSLKIEVNRYFNIDGRDVVFNTIKRLAREGDVA